MKKENAFESRVWIPDIKVCKSERSGDYTIIRYDATEDSGVVTAVGPLISVTKEKMDADGFGIVMEHLRRFRVWPANTRLTSELEEMDSLHRSRFLSDNLMVNVVQRNRHSICLAPNHREGRGWRKVTAYISEEIELLLTADQKAFAKALQNAFALAS